MFFLERFKREKIADGVYFNTIYDDRFKTSRILVSMLTDIDRDRCAANSAVAGLLVHSCKAYPSFLDLSRKLDSLYGTTLSGSSSKRGDSQLVNVSAVGISDAYSLDGESVYEEMAKLLCGALFEPNVSDGAFKEEDFRQEQRQLIDTIDAQFNDKRAYAKKRFLEIMCKDEKYGVNLCGTKEQVSALTSTDVYKAYLELIKTARVEIVCLCANDTENIRNIFRECFANVDRAPAYTDTLIIPRANEVKEHTDRVDVVQSKLMLGFRTDCAEPDENVDAAKLMSAVLGGTAHSKLFNNVREKLSLCYYCVSGYDPNKGVLTVESGVEQENIEKTKAAILNELEQMKQGNITDEELASAKLSMANSYLTSVDSSAGTQGWYLAQVLKGKTLTPQEQAQRINAVTKEQVVAAANRLTLDTVYVLTGSGKEGE